MESVLTICERVLEQLFMMEYESCQVIVHKSGGFKNDPNDWAIEQHQPSYIFDLLLSIINVSVQTVEIVEGLPKVKFE